MYQSFYMANTVNAGEMFVKGKQNFVINGSGRAFVLTQF